MIYFIQGGMHVKIGTAYNVEKRLKLLQTGCPHSLVVLGVMSGYEPEERALHERFASLRTRGEWFAINDELCRFIEVHCSPYLRGLRHTGAAASEKPSLWASRMRALEPWVRAPVATFRGWRFQRILMRVFSDEALKA